MEIKISIDIDAPPKIIFDALTNENELTQWFPDQVFLEPKIGGKIKFTFLVKEDNDLDEDFISYGEIVEFEPNKKISYTWIPSDIPNFPKTLVTWNLKVISKKKTRVELTHTGFSEESQKMYEKHIKIWDHIASKLSMTEDTTDNEKWRKIFTCQCGDTMPACKIELHVMKKHWD